MDVVVRRANRWWVGAAALGLLLATAVPAEAATSVRTADGVLLTVEEVGGPARAGSEARKSRALAFTLEDATGKRTGLVTPTVDAAIDESPVLAVDPRSGRPILIWSRDDGQAMKLVWARFEGGAWIETRFLTFGPGDDRAPAVGTSIAGSYLFWRGADDRVLHAPLDLGTGRLFASPRALPIERDPRGTGVPQGLLSPQGSTDIPVVFGTNGSTDIPVILGTNGSTDIPVVLGTSGATDIPVVLGTNGSTDIPVIIEPPPPPRVTSSQPLIGGQTSSGSSSSPSLTVFSDPSCSTQILLIGANHSRALLAVEFTGTGRVSPLGRFVIHPEMEREAAVSAAGSRYLEASCR